MVLISHSHEGENVNQWASRFGTEHGGRGYIPGRTGRNLVKAGQIIVMAPNLSRNEKETLSPMDKVSWHRTWGEVLAELAGRYGAGTRVSLYPYAPLQMLQT